MDIELYCDSCWSTGQGFIANGYQWESLVGICPCMLHQCWSPFCSYGHSMCIHLNKSCRQCHKWDQKQRNNQQDRPQAVVCILPGMQALCWSTFCSYGHPMCIHLDKSCRQCHRWEHRARDKQKDRTKVVFCILPRMQHLCWSPFCSYGTSTCILMNVSCHRCHKLDYTSCYKYQDTQEHRASVYSGSEAGDCGIIVHKDG